MTSLFEIGRYSIGHGGPLLLLAMAAAAIAGPVDPDTPPQEAVVATPVKEIRYGPSKNGFGIMFFNAEGSEAKITDQERGEVLVAFRRAAPEFDLADLQSRAKGWIDGINVGHDALLLRLAPGVRARAETSGKRLTLWLSASTEDQPDRPAPIESDPEPESKTGSGAQRLELLRARLLLRDQRLTQARERFETLRAEIPDSAQPLAGLAEVESQAGRWRRSAQLYREADRLAGGDPAMTDAADAVERAHASDVRIDAERRRTHGRDVVAPVRMDFAEIKAGYRFGEAWRAGFNINAASINTDSIRRANGLLEPFSGQRERAEFALQHDALNGVVSAVSVFAASGSPGLGILGRRPDDTGTTSGVFEYRRPNWDYVEAIVDHAWRDRLAFTRVQRFGGGLTGRAEVGLNRYGLPGDHDIARSTTLSGEIRYTGLAGLPGLAIVYALDAEYVSRLDPRRTSAGESFAPLPLRDREVHVATLGYSKTVGDRWGAGAFSFNGYAGAGVDRFGLSGPIFALSLGWARGPFSSQLRASHVCNIGRSRGISDSIAALLSLQF